MGWIKALCGHKRGSQTNKPTPKEKYDARGSQKWAEAVAQLETESLDGGAIVVLHGDCPDCKHEISVELPIKAQTGVKVTDARDAQSLEAEEDPRLRAQGSLAFRKIAHCNCQMAHAGRPADVKEGCGSYGALIVGAGADVD